MKVEVTKGYTQKKKNFYTWFHGQKNVKKKHESKDNR